MSSRPKSTLSTNLVLVFFASFGVVIDRFDLDDNGNPLYITFTYPSRSDKVDRDGKVLEGAYLGAKVSEIARKMFPPPVTVDVSEREDEWTLERADFAMKYLMASILQQGQDFNSYIYIQ